MKTNHFLLGKNTIQRGVLISMVLFAVTFLFTSCDNFLNAGKISEDIKETIDYNNAKTVHVNISCEKEMGTIFPDSSYSAKLGYDFEIQFFPNTENYFVNDTSTILEAVDRLGNQSRADCVVFSVQEQTQEEKKAGIYRIKVKVIKESDITIRPNISVLPKVTEIYPPNKPEGVAQDTTIRITFNKPVNPISFGLFSCITIRGATNPNIASCYGKPYFSNNNTILNIPVALGKSIIEDDEDNSYEDVTLNIDFSNITDEEGISLIQNNSYTFRVNKNVDRVKPVLTSLVLKTTQDTTAAYYRTLTAEPFDSWSKSGSQNNPYGDYSTNHVGKNIYIEVSGYDKDSGVNGIQIVESLYKLVEGGDPAGTLVKTGYCGINKFEYVQTDSDNNNIYSLNDTYTFTTFNDGVFKLDISVLDNAGNASTPVTYYVLKDTVIDYNSIKFLETKAYSDYDPTYEYSGEYVDIFDHVRIQQNGSDTVVLTLDSSSVDTFYEGCTSEYELEVLYGDSESSINNRASRNGNVFSYTRKSDQLTFVKLICSDSVGNKEEFLRALPPKPIIKSYSEGYYSPDDESGYYYQYPEIIPKNADMYKNLCETYGADSFGVFYVVRNKTIDNANYGSSPGIRRIIIKDFSYDYSPKEHDFYIVQYYRYGETFWYSVLSSEYVIAKAICYEPYGTVELTEDLTSVNETGSSNQSYTSSFDPYMKDYLTASVQPCLNSGCYKIKLSNYKKQGVDTSNIIYSFECINTSTSEKYSFSEPEFYLPTRATYKVFVYAKEKNGSRYYKSPWCYCYVNGSSAYDSSYSFYLSEELSAPGFDETPHAFTSDTAAYFVEPALPYDNPEGASYAAGMYEDPDHPGYGKIDYYFIPNTNTNIEEYSKYTLQDLQAFEKHTLLYKFTDTSIKIPYGQLDEGLYTLCMVAYDKNGNYAIKCAPALNITKKTKVNPTLTYTGRNEDGRYKFTSDVVDFCLDYYNVSNQKWVNIKTFELPQTPFFGELFNSWYFEFDGKETPSYDGWMKIYGPKFNFTVDDGSHVEYNNTIYNSGFYYVDYKYIPYEKSKVNPNIAVMQCNNKNIIPGVIGLQVICDKSVFAHTLYSSKKLTETSEATDITIWETKGFETGIVVNNETFTYTEDNYSEVPEGWYYTTIIHFADGTAYMTEVKKKK
ncbi:MAG: hypothetical protein IK024_11405 [Treponema sp.]|nr:hypothetical protein [Treponema sp.]